MVMEHFNYSSIKDMVLDKFGRRIVLSLFKEFVRTDFTPLWSLNDDWKPIYLETADPTEYETAMRLIGDWEHWLAIRNHPKIKPIIDKWAKEVEVRIRSKAIRQMAKHANAVNGASAAKWMAEGTFMQRVLKNKQEKADEQEVVDEISKRVGEDMERLGLSVVSGGRAA
jgi:hypothetical protein